MSKRSVPPPAPSAEFLTLQEALAGRYSLEKEIGRGGMATVYLARDLKHERLVALKVLRPELALAIGRERFLREIRVTAQLDHPHILPLLDSGEAAGFLYYVMPYVEGESLRERLSRETQLPLSDALQISRNVADALGYAHSRGIVHRDVKPENILLAGEHARVADFGIARAVSAAGEHTLTETGMAIGTPAYMSPEQAGGGKDVDGRSDIYSLGCVLYEMIAGHPPFSGGTAHEILARHSMDAVPSLAAARPNIPRALEQAIAGALAKTPADRFRTAAAFASVLSGSEPVGAPTPAAPLAAAPRRQVGRLVLAGVVGVLAVGAALWRIRTAPVRPAAAGAAPARTAIAVLPFQNLSADGPHSYFAGGLHDELLTQLSRVAALTVISRTSVMGYAGPNLPPLRQIGSELGVGSIVEASVQVVSGRLRVNVQLIDANRDAPIWSERYDRRLDDAFAIQSDVAQMVVEAVGAALSSAELWGIATPPTANAEAYRLFLQGADYVRPQAGRRRQGLERAQQLFEHALALDSGFALARAALSAVHGLMYTNRHDPSPARAARQLEEAAAALRLAPDLPHAHAAMGLVYLWGRRDYRRALEEYAIALRGVPNDAVLWLDVGGMHRRLGNWNDALAALEKSARLDPRNAVPFFSLGLTYWLMRRHEEAIRAFDRALSLEPDYGAAVAARAAAFTAWQGQLDTMRVALTRLAEREGGRFIGARLDLWLWARQPDSLLRTLAQARQPVVAGGELSFLPGSLYAAWAHRLRHDTAAAQAAFDSALALLDSVLALRPDDHLVHAARGLALAGLGRRDEALREASWLQLTSVYRDDRYAGSRLAIDRALILAQAGAADAALEEVERLLRTPSWITANHLRLDPLWDPIREHRRFRRLLRM